MMGWAIAFVLAGVTFAALVFVLKLPRGGREFAGAALLLGLSGYALQGSPSEPGSPTAPRENAESGQAALIEARRAMGDEFGEGRNYLITADAFARAGQFGAAATLLRGATRKTPNDPDVWLALGNALVGHADGIITPAALYAFQKAADIAPDHPGPPFFTGLALAQSGQFEDARAIWQKLLDRPGEEDAPWRADLAARLARLDAIIAQQQGGQNGRTPATGAPSGDAQMPSGPVPVEQETADSPASDRPGT
ncbi:tetratricopeptide repeat protein [Croceicoccus bisphenolivorans]|uniref:tetratricopeptide repeat protein n=1 Tax=Croceicoccus bisphenolivorans TaxID=1783232 RepID=UPI00083550BD|nr:tetratricopeptide repeat protein [Croceicoccus bisphenolivorans]